MQKGFSLVGNQVAFILLLVLASENLASTSGADHSSKKVVHYSVQITESGEQFNETIEVDTEKQTELFQVPAHNNVDHSNILHDFKTNLSMLLLPEKRICYLLPLDKELSTPRKLISDLDETRKNIRKTQIIDNKWIVEGEVTDRSVLSDELATFCAKYPIYNVVKLEELMTATRIETGGGKSRKRRQMVSLQMIVKALDTIRAIPSEKLCAGGIRRPSMQQVEYCEFVQWKDWKVKCKIRNETCHHIDVCDTVDYCFQKHVMNTIYCCEYECI